MSYEGLGPRLDQSGRTVIEGQLQDRTGRAVNGVVAVRRSGRPVGYVLTAAGRFTLKGLPAGTYLAVGNTQRGAGTTTFPVSGTQVGRVILRVT